MSFYASNLNNVNAIVADIGSYSTKIGYAGDDYPRSYFRSTVGVLRDNNQGGNDDSGGGSSEENDTRKRSKRGTITKVNYDTLNTRAVTDTSSAGHSNIKNGGDGDWEVSNPVDFTTGLWYDNPNKRNGASGYGGDGDAVASSLNSGDDNENRSGAGSTSGNGSTDWSELIPTFLDHGYKSSLGYQSVESAQVPLLMVERSYNPPPIRQQMLEILFEECNVPATFLGRDATMACYACGRTTSTVIDIGYSGTTVSPVFEGYVEQKGIRRSPVGTLAMDELALKQLETMVIAQQRAAIRSSKKKGASSIQPRGLVPLYQVDRNAVGSAVSAAAQLNIKNLPKRSPAFHRLSMLDVAREAREAGACQAINTSASKTIAAPNISYVLPDGTMVDVPSKDRFGVANLAVGRAGSPSSNVGGVSGSVDPSVTTEDTEEETTRQLRDDYLAKTKADYDALLQHAMEVSKQLDGDNDDDNAMDIDGDNDDEDDAKKQAGRYTEATAVGISSRRGSGKSSNRKSVRSKTTTQQQQKQRRRVLFNNAVLQKACLPYLQTCFEDELTSLSVANMVCDAAFRCDRDQQAGVLGNVVLAGGGSCIGPTDQSVPDYIRDQMEAIIHVHTPGWKVRILSPGMQERAVASWLGGSILGSLGSFHDMWITRADYDEWGTAIVNRKCP